MDTSKVVRVVRLALKTWVFMSIVQAMGGLAERIEKLENRAR